jgi:hypothetical protein
MDPLEPDGNLKAIADVKRVVARGAQFLFVVPVGKRKIIFNFHRIYSFEQLRDYFADLELQEFALVPDSPAVGCLIRNAPAALADAQHHVCDCCQLRKYR